jgi:4-amino-4-deoxy-L-arabinose transferase-like glycosyltransferase
VTHSVLALVAIGTMAAAFGGPALGDHEAMVAQCARNMRSSGDWITPRIFDVPFVRKPPLPYWLIAGVSCILPADRETGLPVTATAARLPSGIAAFVTVLLMWQLASSMFGRRVGLVTATIAGSSLVFLLYGANATAEILLTACCTWAYLHFWCAATGRTAVRRFLHAMLFYVALGFGMLAKGPAPIALVAMPLAFWWYTERPLRVLARQGPAAWRRALVCLLRGLWPRTKRAFTQLWLLPGLIVFAAIFVPWMLAVAQQHPHAWDLWNWQYVQRAEGNYEDTRSRGLFYYPPIAIGLTLPWAFLVFEALLAPWLRRYARWHRALLYVGLWAVLGVAVMSLMSFKKPYYLVPAIPGLLLLMGVVADRAYSWTLAPATWVIRLGRHRREIFFANPRRLACMVWMILAAGSTGLLAWAGIWANKTMPAAVVPLTAIAAGAVVALLLAGVAYIRGLGWVALGVTAAATVAAFDLGWYLCPAAIDSVGELAKVVALARSLDTARVPRDTPVYWVDRRPDARLSFYFDRPGRYLVTPQEIVSRMVDRTGQASRIRAMVFARAKERFGGAEPIYLVLQRRHYNLVKDSLPDKVRVVAPAGGPSRPDKDWLVLTNASPTSQPYQPRHQPAVRYVPQ